MKCRQIKTLPNGKKQVIWFNRVIDENGFVEKADNYVGRQEGVASSLTQRLSIIRGELWYNVSAGLPLVDKVTSKGIIDAKILEIVTNHPDVTSINSFKSTLEQHTYSCSMNIVTKYGSLLLSV